MRNGVLDTDVLAPIEPHSPYLLVNPATDLIGYAGLQWLAKGVIPSFLAICRQFREETGKAVFLREAFRSLETQQYYVDHPPSATVAPAGTSPHGWGMAVDVWSGIDDSFTSYEHVVFERIAKPYGWINTGRNFAKPGEPWHFEFKADQITINPSSGGDTTPITPAEDGYELSTDSERADIAQKVVDKFFASQAWTTRGDQQQAMAERVRALAGEDPDLGSKDPRSVTQQVWAFKLGGMLWSASTFVQRIATKLGLDPTKP